MEHARAHVAQQKQGFEEKLAKSMQRQSEAGGARHKISYGAFEKLSIFADYIQIDRSISTRFNCELNRRRPASMVTHARKPA
jgi:hypothetical protein